MYMLFDACEFSVEEPTCAEDVKDISTYLVNMDRVLAIKESIRVQGFTELIFDNGELIVINIPFTKIAELLPK